MWWTKPAPAPDLTPRVEALERGLKALQIDWEVTYEKFRVLLARWNKRARDEEARAQREGTGVSTAAAAIAAPRADGHVLNPLARRLLAGPLEHP